MLAEASRYCSDCVQKCKDLRTKRPMGIACYMPCAGLQALERKLDEIRRKTAGPVSRSSSDPQVQAYTAGASDVDDSSSEEDED